MAAQCQRARGVIREAAPSPHHHGRHEPRRAAGIAKITRPRWLNRVLTTTLADDKPSQLRLTWTVKEPARRELETELFGKRILVLLRHRPGVAT